MAQAVSCRPHTAEARVRSQVSPCEIYGGQIGTVTGFPANISVSPVSIIPPMIDTHLQVHVALTIKSYQMTDVFLDTFLSL
jgi:hypothetical protein